MAILEVPVTVSYPETINVPLVRADVLGTSNIFRVFFEIFLSLLAALGGAMTTMDNPTGFHWTVMVVFTLFTLTFCILSQVFFRRAKSGLATVAED